MSAVLVGGFLLVAVQAPAQQPKGKDDAEKTAKRGAAVAELATASQLIAFGRGEMADTTGLKNFKSPESLVAAAGILLRVNGAIGGKIETPDAKPTDDKDKPVEGEALKVTGLEEEAKALFDEARAMVAGNKERSATLESLIKEASASETRGAVGSPRAYSRNIGVGVTHVYRIPFVTRSPASVTFRSAARSELHFEIQDDPGAIIFSRNGTNASHSWMTGGPGPRSITVRVRNVGRFPTSYTVLTN
jgi:hypothetical protein